MTIEERLRLYEAKWTDALKKAYYKEHPENCAGGEDDPGGFPIKDGSDVSDAWDLAGHASDPDAVRAKIKSIAKRLGLTASLPDTAKDAKESADQQAPFNPKPRIATLTTRFLKAGAVSRNNRVYPRETLEGLVRSGQTQLSDPSASILTCFTSHAAADTDDVTNLTGKITNVYQEGDEGFATFDIPDTSAGRDMVSLIKGNYLKTMSLRAKNAELKVENGYAMPVVRGSGIQLEGIDFTTRPGIEVAQIQSVVTEQEEPQQVTDTFDLDISQMVVETVEEPTPTLTESTEAIKPAETTVDESLPMVKSKLQSAHDTLHEMCMSAKESGKALSKANTAKIGEAHDGIAEVLGIECRYDPDGDGDNDASSDPSQNPDYDQDKANGMYDESQKTTEDTTEKTKQEETPIMTKEEALALLAEQGFDVDALNAAAPKTPEQLMKEEFDAKLAAAEEARKQEFEALKTLIVENAKQKEADPQRQTLSETASTAPTPTASPYRHGAYLKEQLHPSKWAELADRSRPLPKEVNAAWALNEMGAFLSARITERLSDLQGVVF